MTINGPLIDKIKFDLWCCGLWQADRCDRCGRQPDDDADASWWDWGGFKVYCPECEQIIDAEIEAENAADGSGGECQLVA